MKNKYWVIKLFLLLLLGLFAGFKTVSVSTIECDDRGKKLFMQNCRMCHAFDHKLIGPALGGVSNRRTDKWLFNYISNEDKLSDTHDTAVANLKRAYRDIQWDNHTFGKTLSSKQLKALIRFLKEPCSW